MTDEELWDDALELAELLGIPEDEDEDDSKPE